MLQRPLTKSVTLGIVGIAATLFALWWLGMPSPKVSILTARVQSQADGDFVGSIELWRNDAQKIVQREYYAKAHLFPCSAKADYFPADLNFKKIPLDDFQAVSKELERSPDGKVVLSFTLPQQLKRYRNGCITLAGGQMVGFGQISSNVVRLQ